MRDRGFESCPPRSRGRCHQRTLGNAQSSDEKLGASTNPIVNKPSSCASKRKAHEATAEGSNPSPSRGEPRVRIRLALTTSANLTFGGSSRGQFGSEPLVPLEPFRADRLRFRGSIPRFIWSFYANISKYHPNARSCT